MFSYYLQTLNIQKEDKLFEHCVLAWHLAGHDMIIRAFKSVTCKKWKQQTSICTANQYKQNVLLYCNLDLITLLNSMVYF